MLYSFISLRIASLFCVVFLTFSSVQLLALSPFSVSPVLFCFVFFCCFGSYLSVRTFTQIPGTTDSLLRIYINSEMLKLNRSSLACQQVDVTEGFSG